MPTAKEIATKAYALWQDGDSDAVSALFSNALFAIPGRTSISGDHKGRDAVCAVLAPLKAARDSGKHRQQPVCSYMSDGGAMFVYDNFVTVDGKVEQYHSIHEWIMRSGKLVAMMVYIHEYDVFERAWAQGPH